MTIGIAINAEQYKITRDIKCLFVIFYGFVEILKSVSNFGYYKNGSYPDIIAIVVLFWNIVFFIYFKCFRLFCSRFQFLINQLFFS